MYDFTQLTTKDIKEAIKLGNLNFDAIKPKRQAEVRNRIDALQYELTKRGTMAAINR